MKNMRQTTVNSFIVEAAKQASFGPDSLSQIQKRYQQFCGIQMI